MKSLIKALAISLMGAFMVVLCFFLGWYANTFFRTLSLKMDYTENSRCLSRTFYSTMNNQPDSENKSIFKVGIDLISTNDKVKIMTRGDAGFPEINMPRKSLVLYTILSSPKLANIMHPFP